MRFEAPSNICRIKKKFELSSPQNPFLASRIQDSVLLKKLKIPS
jgi:hypothetical protein